MTRYRWLFLALIFFATTLNYFDRVIISVLMPVIREDIAITDQEYGYVTGAFQVAYGLGNLLFGKFIDIAGSRIGYVMALAGWSLATAGHALSRTAFGLGLWRGLLGLGEGGNFPAAAKVIAEWFPRKDRAFAMGVCVAATNVAAMAGPPLLVYMSIAFGWRQTFVISGAAGFVLVLLWGALYRSPRQHKGVSETELAYVESDAETPADAPPIGWKAAIRRRETWGFSIAKFFTDPVWWFYIFWLPLYLHDVRDLELVEIGWALPVIYLMADFGSVAGGWLPGQLMRRGWDPGKARKTAMALCVCWMPLAALAPFAPNVPLTVLLISLGTAGHQGWSANLLTSVSDVYPTRAVATVTGIGQWVASLGGLLFSSVLAGYIITHYGYVPVFLMLGTFHLIGFASIHFLMRDLRPIEQRET